MPPKMKPNPERPEPAYCKFCAAEFTQPGEHWYVKTRYKGKLYYSCVAYEKDKAVKQTKEEKAFFFKRYYDKNREAQIKRVTDYYHANREGISRKAAVRAKKRYKDDKQYRARRLLITATSRLITRHPKRCRLLKYIGCSLEYFRAHIESKFTIGMSWDNYGEWHLDHIVPLSAFDLLDEDQLKKAAYYTNIQPLWALDNLKKGNKISG